MNGGRGAKGSINDRLISMMYRNRYNKLQLQKEAYTYPNKVKEKKFLQTMKTFDIDKIETEYPALEEKEQFVLDEILRPRNVIPEEVPLAKNNSNKLEEVRRGTPIIGGETPVSRGAEQLHTLSDKLIDVDIATEVFDFDRYDYYEIINRYTGIGEIETSHLINVDKEIEKVDDEIVIVEELKTFIADSKEILNEVKRELVEIKSKVPEQVTEKEIKELDEQYRKIQEKIAELKKKYDTVKDKYNFEDFEILASIKMMSAIDDYKDKASLDELETLVDVCKEEIEEIDGVLIEEKRSIGVAEEIRTREHDIKVRDEAFEKNKKGVIYLDDLERKIAFEAEEQMKIIKHLEKQIADFTTETQQVTSIVYHTEQVFGSFLRIAAGILSVPFSGRRVFGTMLGVHLISRGIQGLRDSMTPDITVRTEIVNRYRDVESEIVRSQNYLESTRNMIMGSIEEINKFDREFKEKFQPFAYAMPEYRRIENQIDELKRKLNRKKIEVAIMGKDLERQYEDNKVKVKRAAA